MSEREILMAALASAMEASLTGNPQALLAPGALAEARRLGELIGGHHSRDAEAVMLLAAFHMHRWQCLQAGEDAWDEAQLGTWLSVAAAIDPRLVPPPLRAMAGRATPAGPGTDIHSLNAEAAALAMAFDETGEVGLLDRAIGLWRTALGQVRPEQVAPRAGLLIGLSGGLASRAEHGNMADADEAIACADEAIACAAEAVQLTPPGHDHHATALARLAVAHKSRFLLAGDRDDLTRAIAAARDTVADEYLTHPARVKNLANLADMLRISFESGGQLADLDEAVALNGQARRGAAPDEAAVIQGNLCGVLLLRFDWTQDPADIEEAVRLARIAVATAPRGHPALAGWLCNLSGALQSRAGLPGRLADIIEAISVARQAVAAAPGSHPARVMCLHTLAGALRLRIGLGDVLGVASAERDKDLTEAIELLRAACDAAPAPHPDAAYYLNALSILLRMRGGGADLDEAVTTAAAAVAATPASQQNWCPHLSNLGNASEARFKLTRRREDYLAAMDAWRAAAASPACESQVRLAAAIAWGRLAAAENDTAAAADVSVVRCRCCRSWPGAALSGPRGRRTWRAGRASRATRQPGRSAMAPPSGRSRSLSRDGRCCGHSSSICGPTWTS